MVGIAAVFYHRLLRLGVPLNQRLVCLQCAHIRASCTERTGTHTNTHHLRFERLPSHALAPPLSVPLLEPQNTTARNSLRQPTRAYRQWPHPRPRAADNRSHTSSAPAATCLPATACPARCPARGVAVPIAAATSPGHSVPPYHQQAIDNDESVRNEYFAQTDRTSMIGKTPLRKYQH